MTQTLLIQPTAIETNTGQTGTTASAESRTSFSPHFAEALANQGQETENTQALTSETEDSSTLTIGETTETALMNVSVPSIESFTLSSNSLEQLLAYSSVSNTETTPNTATNIQNNITGQLSNNSILVNLVQGNGDQQLTLNTSGQESASSAIVSNTETSSVIATTTQLTSNQQALISQLQQIIDSGNEKGIVSITGKSSLAKTGPENSTVGLLSTNQEAVSSQELQVGSSFRTVNEELSGVAEKPNQQLAPVRQDSNHQYYNAKTQPQNATNLNGNNQDNSNGDTLAQNNSTAQSQTSTLSSTGGEDAANSFSLSASSANLESGTTQTTATTKPITLPSGTLVYEQDVIQQLAEKFQINRKQLDTQINVKLHPAELGEMKIDLNVKEGVVRANVIAQSQYAQEVVEKNVGKLKTILEEQGFTVDEITVAADSNSADSFDFFDNQLFSSNNSSFTKQNSTSNETVFSIEELTDEESIDNNSSGVNVTI